MVRFTLIWIHFSFSEKYFVCVVGDRGYDFLPGKGDEDEDEFDSEQLVSEPSQSASLPTSQPTSLPASQPASSSQQSSQPEEVNPDSIMANVVLLKNFMKENNRGLFLTPKARGYI